MTLVEFSIDVVTRIGFPDEAYDFQKQFTVSPEAGIAGLQEGVGGATHPRIFRSEHLVHV